MPRKRLNQGLKQRYSPEALQKAVEMVREKRCTMRKASEIYKVPLSTLCDNVNGKSQTNKIGAKPKLSAEIEETLANYFGKLVLGGFNPTYGHVNKIIADFLRKQNMSHLFKNGCPGRDWFYEFKKRWAHKFLVSDGGGVGGDGGQHFEVDVNNNMMMIESSGVDNLNDSIISAAVVNNQQEKINSFYGLVCKHYETFDYGSRPENVWTLDECAFTLDCNESIVMQKKGGLMNDMNKIFLLDILYISFSAAIMFTHFF